MQHIVRAYQNKAVQEVKAGLGEKGAVVEEVVAAEREETEAVEEMGLGEEAMVAGKVAVAGLVAADSVAAAGAAGLVAVETAAVVGLVAVETVAAAVMVVADSVVETGWEAAAEGAAVETAGLGADWEAVVSVAGDANWISKQEFIVGQHRR